MNVAIYIYSLLPWLPNYVCGIVEGWYTGWTSTAGIVDPEGWISG